MSLLDTRAGQHTQRELEATLARYRQNGISDPYEVPEKPELAIASETCTPEKASQRIIRRLQETGYI